MELPPLEEFPAGPRRMVLESLHALYRAADSPGVRTISDDIKADADNDYRVTMNRELVSKVLNGSRWPTMWQLDTLVRWLAKRTVDGRNPDAEALRFHSLYQHAEVAGDSTVRSPAPTSSAMVVVADDEDRRNVGMGVLLRDGSVLTHRSSVTRTIMRGDELYEPSERISVVPLEGRYAWSSGTVKWWEDHPDGFAVLALKLPRTADPLPAPARWAAPPPFGAGVRVFGIHTPNKLNGFWLSGTVLGRSGESWQLDLAIPLATKPYETDLAHNLRGAGVLDASGRVVGVINERLATNAGFFWMTPVDTIANRVPSFEW